MVRLVSLGVMIFGIGVLKKYEMKKKRRTRRCVRRAVAKEAIRDSGDPMTGAGQRFRNARPREQSHLGSKYRHESGKPNEKESDGMREKDGRGRPSPRDPIGLRPMPLSRWERGV